MGKKKKCPELPVGSAPGWMVTYGDMMTLLLTFFVLIVSFSTTEIVKFKAAMNSVRDGLGVWPEQVSVVPDFFLENVEKKAQEAEEFVEDLAQMQEENASLEEIEVYNTPDGVRLILSDSLLFRSASSDLTPTFQGILVELGALIEQREFDRIRVEGHTDDLPISTPRYPSNWELSAARAISVVRFLAGETDLQPDMMSGVGYGEFRPRALNNTPEGRARNRRVEIFLEFEDDASRAYSREAAGQ